MYGILKRAVSVIGLNHCVDRINNPMFQQYQGVGIFRVQIQKWMKKGKYSYSSPLKYPVL